MSTTNANKLVCNSIDPDGSGSDANTIDFGGNMSITSGSTLRFVSGIEIGDSTTNASTSSSIAIGKTSTAATNTHSIAIGETATASSTHSIAIGRGSDGTGAESIAVGYNANASSIRSFASGQSSNASGIDDIVMGFEAGNAGTGNNKIAIGVRAMKGATTDGRFNIGQDIGQDI